MLRTFAAIALTALLPTAALALPEIGQPAPDFTGTDYTGKPVKLSDYKGKIVVLEWTNPECPFVRKHYGSGNMQKLQTYAHDKGVTWISVNSSGAGRQGYMDQSAAKTFFASTRLIASHYLLDGDGSIGKLYGAKTTPHMFVINGEGNVVYMGAIDNKPTPDVKDIDTATNYVRTAIDNTIAGQPVAVTSTQSYGCSVKYAD